MALRLALIRAGCALRVPLAREKLFSLAEQTRGLTRDNLGVTVTWL